RIDRPARPVSEDVRISVREDHNVAWLQIMAAPIRELRVCSAVGQVMVDDHVARAGAQQRGNLARLRRRHTRGSGKLGVEKQGSSELDDFQHLGEGVHSSRVARFGRFGKSAERLSKFQTPFLRIVKSGGMTDECSRKTDRTGRIKDPPAQYL